MVRGADLEAAHRRCIVTTFLPAPTDNFQVIWYRGATVATRDGWIADAKGRGGVITQVPGGFFHDVPAARFGTAAPYVYELAPAWLLTFDGLQYAVDELTRRLGIDDALSNAAAQAQPAADTINAFVDKLKSIGTPLLILLVVVVLAAIAFALYKDLT